MRGRPKTEKCERCGAACEFTTSIGTTGVMSKKVCPKCWDEMMKAVMEGAKRRHGR